MLTTVCRTLSIATLLALTVVGMPPRAGSGERGPTVFAAASLKTALDAVARDWQAKTGSKPVVAYAATSALARQIEQGAQADIFISADQAWMDDLAERDLIDPKSRFNLLGNRLALVAPKGSQITATAEPGFPLAALLGEGRLAIAGVDAVPAGKYGKAALKSLGVWDAVKGKLAQAENVRAALRLVSRGETPLGIVYASDAASDPAVRVVSLFPPDSHPPIVYPAARLKGAESAVSEQFFRDLRSAEATARFEEYGFAALANVNE
jgi:molybdate transport system substrate-binding protein